MDKSGKWSLAPAYDLCYAYAPSGKWTNQHQLSLNGKRDNFTLGDLLSTGQKMDIKNPMIIIEQITSVVSRWVMYAQNAEVKREHSRQIQDNLRLLK